MNPFTPHLVEGLGKWTTYVILKIFLKCLLGFGPKDSNTSGVNQKREVTVMEVKGSNRKRMSCPISRGPNQLERGRVLGQRISEAVLERRVSLSFHCLEFACAEFLIPEMNVKFAWHIMNSQKTVSGCLRSAGL